MRAWLAAALFWTTLPLGALAILATHHITGGRWGEATAAAARALAATLPLVLAALLIPLVFGLDSLFSWTRPVGELPEIVRRKTLYLNEPFFVSRTILYFAIWLLLAWQLDTWRSRQSHGVGLGVAGAMLWVLTTTFFSFDWLMSLEPEWYSDIFGLLFGVQSALAALAFVVLIAWLPRRGSPTLEITAALEDAANLLLALVLGWAFLLFSQYLIIWMGNIPDEIGWFIHRSREGWRITGALAFALLAIVPFALLISGTVKRRRGPMLAVALSILAGHALQTYWLVMPTFHPEGFTVSWIALAAWIGLGGVLLFVLDMRLKAIESELGAPSSCSTEAAT